MLSSSESKYQGSRKYGSTGAALLGNGRLNWGNDTNWEQGKKENKKRKRGQKRNEEKRGKEKEEEEGRKRKDDED